MNLAIGAGVRNCPIAERSAREVALLNVFCAFSMYDRASISVSTTDLPTSTILLLLSVFFRLAINHHSNWHPEHTQPEKVTSKHIPSLSSARRCTRLHCEDCIDLCSVAVYGWPVGFVQSFGATPSAIMSSPWRSLRLGEIRSLSGLLLRVLRSSAVRNCLSYLVVRISSSWLVACDSWPERVQTGSTPTFSPSYPLTFYSLNLRALGVLCGKSPWFG